LRLGAVLSFVFAVLLFVDPPEQRQTEEAIGAARQFDHQPQQYPVGAEAENIVAATRSRIRRRRGPARFTAK
jgi:hypothetical protein